MDKELDDLIDGPKHAPSRSSRFAPKGSKFQPKPKPKPNTEPKASSSLPAVKKEEVDIKPEIADVKPELDIKPEVKPEYENGAVKMDVEQNLSEMKLDVEGDAMETDAPEVEIERGDGDGDNDDEDTIVREMDVYFTPNVDPETRLYLFQYPLRPVWRPYELDERCEEVRVKPASADIQVDLAIDVNSMNYDARVDSRLQMKKQTLSLSWEPPQTNGYTVGVLKGNQVHLNPIHAVVQLRPSMRHLEVSKKKTGAEGVVKSEEHQESKPSKVPKNQKASEQIKDNGEDWVPLKYHSMRSDMAVGYLEKMIAREDSQIHFSMSSGEYLNSLCPGTSGDRLSSKVPPIRSLLTKPLKERFRTWLLEGPPLHRFDTLKHLAPDESIEEVLAVLQELAVLVQGLWAPKTSLMPGTEGYAGAARDFVLLLFSKDVIFKKAQLPTKTVMQKAVEGVLPGLATFRKEFKDWKLKQLPDLNFIKLNPAVVRKQQEEWESVEKKISHIFVGKNGPGTKTSKFRTPTNLVALQRSDKLAAGTSSVSMSEIVRKAIKKGILELFKSSKTCSFQQINQWLRDNPVSESAHSAANSIDAFPDELQAIISEVAVNVHGIYVQKSSPDNPEYDGLRKVVIDLFLAGGPNAKVRKANITEAANVNNQNMSEAAYKKVVAELCVSQGSAWVLKRGS